MNIHNSLSNAEERNRACEISSSSLLSLEDFQKKFYAAMSVNPNLGEEWYMYFKHVSKSLYFLLYNVTEEEALEHIRDFPYSLSIFQEHGCIISKDSR